MKKRFEPFTAFGEHYVLDVKRCNQFTIALAVISLVLAAVVVYKGW